MKKTLLLFCAAIAVSVALSACTQTAVTESSEASAESTAALQSTAVAEENNASESNASRSDKSDSSSTSKDESSAVISESSESENKSEITGGSKALIVYFSWSSSGNTEKIANVIAERTNADILRLEPTVAYPDDYTECGNVAKAERDENARPEISNLPQSIDEYDTVFVGYPIWWHTAPMIIGTFLESYDLTDTDIYPFSQSASMDTEQFANSVAFVRECAANANVHDGLFVSATDTDGILSYLSSNGFAE